MCFYVNVVGLVFHLALKSLAIAVSTLRVRLIAAVETKSERVRLASVVLRGERHDVDTGERVDGDLPIDDGAGRLVTTRAWHRSAARIGRAPHAGTRRAGRTRTTICAGRAGIATRAAGARTTGDARPAA